MANITQWDPIREMVSMHDAMDRIFDDFFSKTPQGLAEYDGFVLNMVQNNDEVIVTALIPGAKPENIQISITGGILTIRGEMFEEGTSKDSEYLIKEIRSGNFARSITLPSKVNPNKANADFENGILKLRLPKAEEIKPKTITIKAKLNNLKIFLTMQGIELN